MLTAAEVRAQYGEAGLIALTDRMRREAARLRSLRDVPGPLGLLLDLNPTWVATPALRLISDEVERAITEPGTRLAISMPPQEGKSRLMRCAVVRALQHRPENRVAIASYQERLARKSGEAARNMVVSNGSNARDPVTGAQLPDRLGIAVQSGSAAAGDWSVAGHEGGVLSVGVGSGITGNAVDVLFVDDPLKGRAQADSEVIRAALHDWWDNDADSRLGPLSSVIIIQTRWHEDDLIGRLAEGEPEDEDAIEFGVDRDDDWRVVNIPAFADGQTHDSLAGVPGGRTPDGWLISARGDRTPKWRRLQRKRPRVWASLYQGRPAPLEGGIFKRDWFENSRVLVAPPLREIVIGVDPAETGTGDAAGILVVGRADDAQLYVLADLSGQLTQAQWARRICLGLLRYGAHRVIAERTLGMNSAIRDAWAIVRRQALALRNASVDDLDRRVVAAAAAMRVAGDEQSADEAALREVDPLADAVLGLSSRGPRVQTVTPKSSKRVRAEAVTSLFELGRAHIVGTLPVLEHEAATWQEGQPSPNRIDVMAHVLAQLENRPARRGPPSSSGGGGSASSAGRASRTSGGGRRGGLSADPFAGVGSSAGSGLGMDWPAR